MPKTIKLLFLLGLAIILGFALYAIFTRPDRRPTEAISAEAPPASPQTQSEHGELPFPQANASSTTTNQAAAAPNAESAIPQKSTVDALFAELNSAATSDQLKAVGELFQRKRSLSDTELLALLTRLLAIANDATIDQQFRADSIWALAGVAMLAKERGILTARDIATQCAFLADVAGQESADLNVRRVAIKALGDLRMTSGVPVLTALLADPNKWNTPEIARPACIAIATITPTEALTHIAPLLSTATNPAVADTAAYALGLTGDPAVLHALMANRRRLGDNLSVDNAVQALSSNVFAALSDHQSPHLPDAIRATVSLWKPEQQAQFTPLLLQVLQEPATPIPTRELALNRLLEHASTLPLTEEKQLLSQIQPIAQRETAFAAFTNEINRRINATVLEPVAIEPRKPEVHP